VPNVVKDLLNVLTGASAEAIVLDKADNAAYPSLPAYINLDANSDTLVFALAKLAFNLLKSN